MSSRERFIETINKGNPDRVPYFEEGIRADVFRAWKKQGLKSKGDLESMFPCDKREELEIDVYPRFPILDSSFPLKDNRNLEKSLSPEETRLPSGWRKKASAWNKRQHVLMLEVHHGFFLTMGVSGWDRFNTVMEALYDQPDHVREILQSTSNMISVLTGKFLEKVEVDAVIFSEPIGGNNGPLLSPRMYEEFVLESYKPVINIVRRHGVKCVILRTYANARALIPSILKFGFNCLWACEVNSQAMDYRSIRTEFGRDLNLIGGIDLDVLRGGKDAIRKEIEEKVPPLVYEGGYVPLADGRVRADISLENYIYYRELLQQVTQS